MVMIKCYEIHHMKAEIILLSSECIKYTKPYKSVHRQVDRLQMLRKNTGQE